MYITTKEMVISIIFNACGVLGLILWAIEAHKTNADQHTQRVENVDELQTEKKFPRRTKKPIRPIWVDEDLNELGDTEPQPTTDCRRSMMTLDDAYYLVYKDLTKEDGLLTGKYDAKNGSKQFMNGVWTVMELIAYGVGIDCYEAFNERFCRNLEKSEEEPQTHEIHTETHSCVKDTHDKDEPRTDCAWK